MKNLFLVAVISLFCSQFTYAEGLLLKADLDPREVNLPNGYKLWSDLQAEKVKARPMREEVMTTSSLYLEGRISQSDFLQYLKTWAELGFNQQERVVLTDTIQKSALPISQKNQWLCRLDSERNCVRIKLVAKHLSPILQKYEWLIVDGQAYPKVSWDEISIPDEPMSWVFYSSRFETYSFKGKWEDLKFKNPNLFDWVSGTCENFYIQSAVQDFENHVLLNRNCLKSSLAEPKKDPSFYEKNKKVIWAAAGLFVGVTAFNNYSGKKIILEKPSFR